MSTIARQVGVSAPTNDLVDGIAVAERVRRLPSDRYAIIKTGELSPPPPQEPAAVSAQTGIGLGGKSQVNKALEDASARLALAG